MNIMRRPPRPSEGYWLPVLEGTPTIRLQLDGAPVPLSALSCAQIVTRLIRWTAVRHEGKRPVTTDDIRGSFRRQAAQLRLAIIAVCVTDLGIEVGRVMSCFAVEYNTRWRSDHARMLGDGFYAAEHAALRQYVLAEMLRPHG